MADEETRVKIRIAGNTTVPSLQAIIDRGYQVQLYFLGQHAEDWESPQWEAKTKDRAFSATTVQELLGLIAMWESQGDKWQSNIEQADTLYEELYEHALVYDADGNIIEA